MDDSHRQMRRAVLKRAMPHNISNCMLVPMARQPLGDIALLVPDGTSEPGRAVVHFRSATPHNTTSSQSLIDWFRGMRPVAWASA